MERRARLIPLVTVCMATPLMVVGLAAIAAYVAEFMGSGDAADRSGLFWYLPILQIGGLCVIAAGLLFWAALGAYRGHPASLLLCRIAVVVLPVLALLLTGALWLDEEQARERRAESQQRQALLETLIADRQRIERFSVSAQDDGLRWRATTSGGRPGTYKLRLRVEGGPATLYRHEVRVELGQGGRPIRRELPYTALFAKCFDGRDVEGLYVCVANAGTSNTRLRLLASLHPERLDNQADVDLAGHREAFASRAEREAVIDTYTESGRVEVQRITIP